MLNAACPRPLKHSRELMVTLCQSMQTPDSKVDIGHHCIAPSNCLQVDMHPSWITAIERGKSRQQHVSHSKGICTQIRRASLG